MKFLLRTLGGVLATCVALWVLGAAEAGLFIRDVDGRASESSESSVEVFSRSKKFIDIGCWRVAYIDRGTGDPVVLRRGWPFQHSEYHKSIPLLARRFHNPTLLLWGKRDANFGSAIAERLQGDIPGVARIDGVANSAHLRMLEEPEIDGSAIYQFLSASDSSRSIRDGLAAEAQ